MLVAVMGKILDYSNDLQNFRLKLRFLSCLSLEFPVGVMNVEWFVCTSYSHNLSKQLSHMERVHISEV